MPLAKVAWMGFLGAIVYAVLVLLGIDLYLWLTRRPTVSNFLRAEPSWYWYFAAAGVVAVIALGLHLFLDSADMP